MWGVSYQLLLTKYLICGLLLFALINAFNILIIWHWFFHFLPTLLLKCYWLKIQKDALSTTPNYLAYSAQGSVYKVEVIQKNQKTAECRNPPLSQKRLQRKRNNTSVPCPPVAPICLVCQVKDVLFSVLKVSVAESQLVTQRKAAPEDHRAGCTP